MTHDSRITRLSAAAWAKEQQRLDQLSPEALAAEEQAGRAQLIRDYGEFARDFIACLDTLTLDELDTLDHLLPDPPRFAHQMTLSMQAWYHSRA
jgi:hypothetical protein